MVWVRSTSGFWLMVVQAPARLLDLSDSPEFAADARTAVPRIVVAAKTFMAILLSLPIDVLFPNEQSDRKPRDKEFPAI